MARHLHLAAVTFFTLAGCQSGPQQKGYEDESQKSRSVVSYGGGVLPSKQLIKIPVGVEYGMFSLLGTPATAYSVYLDDCVSLYRTTVTEANIDGVEVYKDDRNCLAKLVDFTVAGVSYNATNPGASDFTTWEANDTALFASAGGNLIRVKVVSQLSSPIAGTEAVVYHFSELMDGQGDYTYSEAEISDAHSITVESQEAPRFNLVQATFEGINGVSGAGRFRFKLECVDDPTLAVPTSVAMTAGSGSDTRCGTNDLQDISYKLVLDTFGSTLTITQAEGIFSDPGSTVTLPDDQYQDTATNEGFFTTALDGPGPIGDTDNANMILIIKGELSFTYFNVDITPISQ